MTLPPIDFDGQIVKPMRGVYSCPHKCGDKRYHQPTWKTQKGFRKHMEVCPKGLTAAQTGADRADQEESEREIFIASHPYAHAIGDVVNFVHQWVKLPAYKNGRRVRYDEVLGFRAIRTTVTKLTATRQGNMFPAYICGTFLVLEHEIIADEETAERLAAERQAAHEAHLKFSSDVR